MSAQTRTKPAIDTPTSPHSTHDDTTTVDGAVAHEPGPVVLHFTPDPIDLDFASAFGVVVRAYCGIERVPIRPVPADAVVCYHCHRASLADLAGRANALIEAARGGLA